MHHRGCGYHDEEAHLCRGANRGVQAWVSPSHNETAHIAVDVQLILKTIHIYFIIRAGIVDVYRYSAQFTVKNNSKKKYPLERHIGHLCHSCNDIICILYIMHK